MVSAGALLTAQTVMCETLVTDNLKYDTSSFSGWNRHSGVAPIEIEAAGMLSSSANPPADHSAEASNAADFGAASYGTVTVTNSGTSDLSSSKQYLVQVKTTAMVNKECPIIVTQVVPASDYDSTPGTWTGDWRKMTAMTQGIIPCAAASADHFNVWFRPGATIKAGSTFWFSWYIPQTAAPGVVTDVAAINTTLPTVP